VDHHIAPHWTRIGLFWTREQPGSVKLGGLLLALIETIVGSGKTLAAVT